MFAFWHFFTSVFHIVIFTSPSTFVIFLWMIYLSGIIRRRMRKIVLFMCMWCALVQQLYSEVKVELIKWRAGRSSADVRSSLMLRSRAHSRIFVSFCSTMKYSNMLACSYVTQSRASVWVSEMHSHWCHGWCERSAEALITAARCAL